MVDDMTVAELIVELQKLSPGLEVWMESDDYTENGLSGETAPAGGLAVRPGYPVLMGESLFKPLQEVGRVPDRVVLLWATEVS